MKLQARPKQVRIHSFRLDAEHWTRFQALADKKGWQALSALRQLILQYAAQPFALENERMVGGDGRTGWFECDACAVAALQAGADAAGIGLNDAMRQLVARALRVR